MRRGVVAMTVVAMTWFCVLTQGAVAEMRPKPTLGELCADAHVIVLGQVEKEETEELTANFTFRILAFRIKRVLKGTPRTDNLPDGRRPFLLVLVQDRVPHTDHIRPRYEPDTDYVLFLAAEVLEALYVKCDVDRAWGAHPASDSLIDRIEEIVKSQQHAPATGDGSDNVRYSIPEGSKEVELELTERERREGYARKAEYRLDGQKVGERAWYANGTLIYEAPAKQGRKHGVFRAWQDDGILCQEMYYKHGKLHGPNRIWDGNRALNETYWIEDELVTRDTYRKRMSVDKTLPPLESQTKEAEGEK